MTGAAEVSPPGAVVFVPSVVKVLKVVAGRSVAEGKKKEKEKEISFIVNL